MKKTIVIGMLFLMVNSLSAQKAPANLSFQQGQTLGVTVEVKTVLSQEAMGNAIDLTVNGQVLHAFKVTNATADNTTLHHDVRNITFDFDGMGQKMSFNSDNKKDMDGFFGKPVKDILSKSYDAVIDNSGKVLLVKPEKIELAKVDDRLAIVLSMLKDLTSVIYAPKKNEASFFKIFPDKEINLNEGWVESTEDVSGKSSTSYTLTAITDSTMVVDFKGTSVTTTKAEIMGTPTSTTLNNSFKGNIIIDKTTGIMKEKNVQTESNGSTEAMGGNMPVTSKNTITVRVRPID